MKYQNYPVEHYDSLKRLLHRVAEKYGEKPLFLQKERGEYRAYSYSDVLSDVSFADPTKTGLVTLGTHIFYNCQSLTKVVLPTQFQTTDEESIFYTGYDSYSGYTIPSYMFAGTGIVNAVLPKTIEYG